MYRYGLSAPQRSIAGSDSATSAATSIFSTRLDQMEPVSTVLATSDANEWYYNFLHRFFSQFFIYYKIIEWCRIIKFGIRTNYRHHSHYLFVRILFQFFQEHEPLVATFS